MSKEFDSVLAQYGPLLSRVAASYEANEHLKQELLQEICLAVWQSLSGFQAKSSLKTYILRVAHNKAVSHVAYNAKQPHNDSYDESLQAESDPTTTTEKQVQQDRTIESLIIAVRKLPIQSRQVFTLSMEGLGYQEIAEVCGLSSVNVGVILTRTKKMLMETLQHER